MNSNQSFAEKVRAVVSAIPLGNTLSYKEVATLAGNPGAARAVGSLMRKNYDESIPCHRVIKSSGKLGEYNRGGEMRKRELLESERGA